MRTKGEITRFRRPGKRGSVAAEVSSERTTALAEVAVLTLRSPLLQVNGLGFSNVRATRNNYVPLVVVIPGYLLFEIFFHTGKRKRRKELAIG